MHETESINDLLERWGDWTCNGRQPDANMLRIDQAVARLRFPDKCIGMRRCVRQQTVREVAALFDCSQQTVHQVYAAAAGKVAGRVDRAAS